MPFTQKYPVNISPSEGYIEPGFYMNMQGRVFELSWNQENETWHYQFAWNAKPCSFGAKEFPITARKINPREMLTSLLEADRYFVIKKLGLEEKAERAA